MITIHRFTVAAVLTLGFMLSTLASADEKLAQAFMRQNAAALKDFDPVADALKAEGLKGKELKREAARIKAGLGEHGIAAGEKAKAARRHNQRRDQPAAGGTSVDQQRLARAMRARQKKAAVLAYYGQLDAWNAAAMNANIGWGLRFVGHY